MHDGGPDIQSKSVEDESAIKPKRSPVSIKKVNLVTKVDISRGFSKIAEVSVHGQGSFMTQNMETGALLIGGDVENVGDFTGMLSVDLEPIFTLAGRGKFEIELNGFIFKSI